MKKRVALCQAKELTETQIDKLRKLWKPEPGDFYCSPCNDGSYRDYGVYMYHNDGVERYKPLPLLDMGQMIELLGQEKTGRAIMRDWKNNELCDALWDAVKQIL